MADDVIMEVIKHTTAKIKSLHTCRYIQTEWYVTNAWMMMTNVHNNIGIHV